MKKVTSLRLIQVILVLALGATLIMTICQVSKLQGTARVINYAGIARGGTQRLIKLEIVNLPDDELKNNLDTILYELANGGKVNQLTKLSDDNYQRCLTEQTEYWEYLKEQIEIVREKGAKNSDIINASERYFELANATVDAAEKYSDHVAKLLAACEICMAVVILLFLISSLILYRVTSKITLLKEQTIRHQAEHDVMTELLNRRSFDDILLSLSKTEMPYTLILIDVDYFKHYNDEYGHAVGDQVLKSIASILSVTFRGNDYVCRIGGDEFAVIMVGVPSKLQNVVSEKIREIRIRLPKEEVALLPVTLSIGAAFSDTVPVGMDIFNAADSALYEVKENGRNGFSFFDNSNMSHVINNKQ